MPRDEGWTACWDYRQWQRGWAGPLGHMGREREREDPGPKETPACGLGWDEPMSGRWGFQLCGWRGRLQVMTSADSWWRAGYEQGVVISMKFIRSLSWLKRMAAHDGSEILNKRASSTGLVSWSSMCSKSAESLQAGALEWDIPNISSILTTY